MRKLVTTLTHEAEVVTHGWASPYSLSVWAWCVIGVTFGLADGSPVGLGIAVVGAGLAGVPMLQHEQQ